MKRIKLILFLIFITLNLMAPPPERNTLYLPIENSVICTDFEPLIRAIVKVESKGDTTAYNPLENAVGAFQIRQCKITDYNNKRGTNYTLEDCYDYTLSKQIFLYFAKGKSWEQAAKDWNGSGPKTINYWNNVKNLI